jgi:hypothetical protein
MHERGNNRTMKRQSMDVDAVKQKRMQQHYY